MRHILSITKTYNGHVPTSQAADYEHLLARIGGRCNTVHVDTSDKDGKPHLLIMVTNISCLSPFELRLVFTDLNYVHIEVAVTRDGAAMFFGLADLLLKIGVDIWHNMTPRDLKAFAYGLEIS